MIDIPTIAELSAAILSDLQTQFGFMVTTFGRNFLRGFSLTQAAKLKNVYLGIASVQKNIWVDTAEPEDIGGTLERFGRVFLGRNPYPARAGQYTVTVTGAAGAVFPAQLTFKSDDTSASPGKLFILDTLYTMTGATGTITIRALEAGEDSKLSIGNTLTATAPVGLASQTVTVATEAVQPIAAEDLEDYRRKAEDSRRLEPQGGAPSDYRLWSADAAGEKQAYPYAWSGHPNEINVYIEATLVDSVDGKGTPTAQILADVAADIEFDPDTTNPLDERGRRPLGVFDVHVLPVSILEVDITIPQVPGATFTTTQQTAIIASITQTIAGVRPFIAGADIYTLGFDILDGNKIALAISTAVPGAPFGSVSFTVGGSPAFSFQFINGNIPYLDPLNVHFV